MRLRDLPIQQKLQRMILLTCGLVLLLVCIAFYGYEFFTFRENLQHHVRSIARVVAVSCRDPLLQKNADDAADALSTLNGEPNILRACLYDETGKIIAIYPENKRTANFPAPHKKEDFYFRSGVLEVFQPVTRKSQTLGYIYLQSSLRVLNNQLLLYAGVTVVFVLLSFLLAIVLSKALQKNISNPILRLSKLASTVSNDHDYKIRAQRYGADEIGMLTDAFNDMLSQIEAQNNEITSFNQRLKEKVRQRTIQLEKANSRLAIANEKLLKSNQDLEQFAYIASHDLQEPLRKIRTFADLLESKLTREHVESPFIERIQRSAERMSALIQSILNYSRLSRWEQEVEDVQLEEVFRNVLTDLELLIEDKNASITADALPVIEGNKVQLAQLFYNLLSNSLKFCRKRPEITIRSTIVSGEEILNHPTAVPKKKYAKICFSDNGIGFEQEYEEKVFTIFQRLHSQDEFQGTGIGLALCKKVIDNHDGFIEVKSEAGKGTIFFIYLPLYTRWFPAQYQLKTK